jgi:hypothetical protein
MALISNIGAGIFTKLKYKADSSYTLPTSDAEQTSENFLHLVNLLTLLTYLVTDNL